MWQMSRKCDRCHGSVTRCLHRPLAKRDPLCKQNQAEKVITYDLHELSFSWKSTWTTRYSKICLKVYLLCVYQWRSCERHAAVETGMFVLAHKHVSTNTTRKRCCWFVLAKWWQQVGVLKLAQNVVNLRCSKDWALGSNWLAQGSLMHSRNRYMH